MSAIRILGGITYVQVSEDGQQSNPLPLRGDAEIMPQVETKEIIIGEDGVHGVMITPMAPSIKISMTVAPNFALDPILRSNNLTVTVGQANGTTWTLSCASVVDEVTIGTKESEMSIKFAGILMGRTANGDAITG